MTSCKHHIGCLIQYFAERGYQLSPEVMHFLLQKSISDGDIIVADAIGDVHIAPGWVRVGGLWIVECPSCLTPFVRVHRCKKLRCRKCGVVLIPHYPVVVSGSMEAAP